LKLGQNRYRSQCYEDNEFSHTAWYGTQNCTIAYITSYIALGMCALWIPELLVLMKVHPTMAEKPKVFVTKKERIFGKLRLQVSFKNAFRE
jgi:hypothetical protein